MDEMGDETFFFMGYPFLVIIVPSNISRIRERFLVFTLLRCEMRYARRGRREPAKEWKSGIQRWDSAWLIVKALDISSPAELSL